MKRVRCGAARRGKGRRALQRVVKSIISLLTSVSIFDDRTYSFLRSVLIVFVAVDQDIFDQVKVQGDRSWKAFFQPAATNTHGHGSLVASDIDLRSVLLRLVERMRRLLR